ncbi:MULTISPECIES: DUF3597 domain-containing protein [Rhizobium/Agrobacterium group]|jgi:hypothetical protein|uniref:DUF3597 domain-containing protein n=1 Tax=Rhizobium/Agrobacterium group TaxID=227290 RepID=UPI0007122F87|nr:MULTISPECIES: DUF3597 domain-containing protein [Rhizobium/Agrobacterium group]RYE66701.1 MAG: DUF3597 domain-containing protein [Rhizobiaceae bacterium]KQQ36370.1 hypothetical protein ASG19_07950 [Rhizobium sp. Leaf306]KQQ71116.1 hypothetical protein ASF70_20075 [Rhizobium sp. Leaf321]MBD8651362.1 DUF3597 domain-containing protein [Rhizobium sp. CFBP 13726]NSY17372.1 DUF3597 domain-containing protein [Neorhizobium sp. AL 9.2.2]
MSIFSKIKDAIFGHPAAAAPASPTGAEPTPTSMATPEPAATTAPPVGGTAQAAPKTAGAPPVATPGSTSATMQTVDIAPVLDAAVKKSGQKLDWKHSIVDLMKALGMDASLSERKELADELGYTGDQSDSATMNMWLHKALLKKLSENGGKVPAELLD